MMSKCTFKRYLRAIAGVSLLIGAISIVEAQELAAGQQESRGSSPSVEVIEVTGDQSLLMFRAQMRYKQRLFYNELNTILEDELFHVQCSEATLPRRTGSHVIRKQWQCVPNFAETLREKANFGSDEGLLGEINNALLANKFKEAYAEKEQQMMLLVKQAIDTSPELNEKYQDFMNAQEAFKAKHTEKFGSLSAYASEDASGQ